MKICYDLAIDDLVAFNRHHYLGNRWARMIPPITSVCAVVFIARAVVVTRVEDALPELAVAAFLAICAWGYRRFFDHQARMLYSDGANKGLFGPQELELIGDELVDRSQFREMRTRFVAVERISATADHTFIYISAVMAHVIPHAAIVKGDLVVFLDALRARMAQKPL